MELTIEINEMKTLVETTIRTFGFNPDDNHNNDRDYDYWGFPFCKPSYDADGSFV